MTQFSSLYSARLDRELGAADSTQLFTTARRKSAINEAQAEFADLTDCLQRQSTVTWPGGTAELNLTSTTVIADGDFSRVSNEPVQFYYTDASSYVTVLEGDEALPRRDVPWLNRYQAGWQQSTVASSVQQLPTSYYLRADGGALWLGMTPVPSTGSSASMAVVIPYLAQPTVLTSDTQEPFVVGGVTRTDLRTYHQALVHYAAHLLEKLRRDEQASDRQLQRFVGYVARFHQNMRQRGAQVVTYATRRFVRSNATSDAKDPRT